MKTILTISLAAIIAFAALLLWPLVTSDSATADADEAPQATTAIAAANTPAE